MLPEHVVKNREAWTQSAPDWVESGRKSWESPDITWGIWEVPETQLGALGDLSKLKGLDAIELGCGTGYVSAWLAKLGAKPVGIDITPAQLETARAFQAEFGLEFPLIEASAEQVPLPDAGFDLVISEYGASIWCDPTKWIAEASRLLRPGGVLVFLRNSTIGSLTAIDDGPSGTQLMRDYHSIDRMEWSNPPSVEFQMPPGKLIRLLRSHGFEIEDLIEIFPPVDASETRHDYIALDWARKWPSEEIWRARKKLAAGNPRH
jgi:SAM-dependent methyltransferase